MRFGDFMGDWRVGPDWSFGPLLRRLINALDPSARATRTLRFSFVALGHG